MSNKKKNLNFQYPTQRKTVIKMIEIEREMTNTQSLLSGLGIDMSGCLPCLSNLILDIMGFPIEGNSLGRDKKTGKSLNPNYFCRDYYNDVISFHKPFCNEPPRTPEEVYELLVEQLKLIKEANND